MPLFRKVLIANRGEIALRVIRACKELKIPTVAIHSEVDATALYVKKADEACLVGPGPVAGYLNPYRIVELAQQKGADAIVRLRLRAASGERVGGLPREVRPYDPRTVRDERDVDEHQQSV